MSESGTARAVFLDIEGTLVADQPFSGDPDRIVLLPGVGDALRALQDAGFLLLSAANQPGVALGHFRLDALAALEARLDELLAPFGVLMTAYGWCPHHPASVRVASALACTCRKPRPGLLREAAASHGIALARSWMIGDRLDDVETGLRAGCRTILVDHGADARWRTGRLRTPNAIVYDFSDAAAIVIERSAPRRRRTLDATSATGASASPDGGHAKA